MQPVGKYYMFFFKGASALAGLHPLVAAKYFVRAFVVSNAVATAAFLYYIVITRPIRPRLLNTLLRFGMQFHTTSPQPSTALHTQCMHTSRKKYSPARLDAPRRVRAANAPPPFCFSSPTRMLSSPKSQRKAPGRTWRAQTRAPSRPGPSSRRSWTCRPRP